MLQKAWAEKSSLSGLLLWYEDALASLFVLIADAYTFTHVCVDVDITA